MASSQSQTRIVYPVVLAVVTLAAAVYFLMNSAPLRGSGSGGSPNVETFKIVVDGAEPASPPAVADPAEVAAESVDDEDDTVAEPSVVDRPEPKREPVRPARRAPRIRPAERRVPPSPVEPKIVAQPPQKTTNEQSNRESVEEPQPLPRRGTIDPFAEDS